MNVSLPDPMKDWVESQARIGKYTNASDYVRDLIRRDQARVDALTKLQRQIEDGFQSGVSERSMDDVLEIARNKAATLARS